MSKKKSMDSDDLNRLSQEVESLKSQLEDAKIDDFISTNSKAFEKGIDEFGVGGGNSMNYHTAIEQDLDAGTLMRCLVTEGWFYIAVWTIAKTIAAIPIKLQRGSTKQEPIDPKDPNAGYRSVQQWQDASGEPEQLIFEYPNDLQPAVEFYWLILMDLLSTGNAFIMLDIGYSAIGEVKSRKREMLKRFGSKAYKQIFNTKSELQGMYRLNPSLVQPVARPNSGLLEGYAFNGPDAIYKFGLNEVVHIKLPNPVDPFLGLSPIVPVFKNLLLDRYSTEHMIRFWKQGARLGGIVTTTQKLSKDQLTRFQRSLEQEYTGRQNHHRTLVLPQGMDYKAIEQNPGETSLIEFSKSNREPILSTFNVPPIKVGLLDGATYANATTQEKIFFTDTIIPIITLIEQSLNKSESILPSYKKLRVKYDLTGIAVLQENETEKAETGKKLAEAGWTINEVREKVWKMPGLKGGDQSPAIHKLESGGGGFPIFGASANPGYEKDGDPEAMRENALSHLSGPQITSVMNICRRVANEQLNSDAALVMLTTMFSIPDPKARAMLGMPQVEIVQEKIDANPQQPDAAVIASDITPTKVSFEERVQQLVAQMIANGVPVDQAVAQAIQQARIEGFEPTTSPMSQTDVAPQADNQTADEQKEDGVVSAPEWTPVLVGDEPKKPLDEDDKSNQLYGDGGTHIHQFPASSEKTEIDGAHIHIFVLRDGQVIQTSPSDGKHQHDIPTSGTGDMEPSGSHQHTVIIDGEEILTEVDGSHTHEYASDRTNLSGDHIHVLKLSDGMTINSQSAADIHGNQNTGVVATAMSSEEDLKAQSYAGTPFKRDDVLNYCKAMTGEGASAFVEKRANTAKEFFRRLEKLALDNWSKKLRKYGIHYKHRKPIFDGTGALVKAGDDIIDKKKRNEFIKQETPKAAENFLESMKYGFDGNLLQFKLGFPNKQAAKVADKIAAKMVTEVTDSTIDKLNTIISDQMESGATVADVSTEIRKYFDEEDGFTPARVQTISRTETLMAISVGQDKKNEEFKKEFPEEGKRLRKAWFNSQDERVRGNPDGMYPDSTSDHWTLEGEIVDVDDEFSNGLKFPRQPGAAPEEVINCLLPGTRVRGNFVAGIKSKYQGPAFEIKTSSGQHLKVTPNHPILTDKGFVPACELRVSDNLICDKSIIGTTFPEINEQNKPALVEDVFETLRICLSSTGSHLGTNNLHGDARFVIGEVDIVRPDSKLRNKVTIDLIKKIKDFPLMKKLMSVSCLSGNSSLRFPLDRILISFSSLPSTDELVSEFIRIFPNGFPFMSLGIGLSSELNSFLHEPSVNITSTDAKLLSESISAYSAIIATDKIVEINEFRFDGHVYDLQTDSGLLIAENIVQHNCRCTYMTFLPEDQEDIISNISPLSDVDEGPEEKSADLSEKGGAGSGCSGPNCGRPRNDSGKPMSAPSGSISKPTIVELDERSPQHGYFSLRNILIESRVVRTDHDAQVFESWWRVGGGSEFDTEKTELIDIARDFVEFRDNDERPLSTPPATASAEKNYTLPKRKWKGFRQ